MLLIGLISTLCLRIGRLKDRGRDRGTATHWSSRNTMGICSVSVLSDVGMVCEQPRENYSSDIKGHWSQITLTQNSDENVSDFMRIL